MKLKATGIVRRIDSLGRIVIPKELCRTMRIKDSDPIEIFITQDGEYIVLKPYNPYGEQDWDKALQIGQAILDKPFAIYDREGERRAKTPNAEQLPTSITNPEAESNCYELADGGDTYAYIITKTAAQNTTLAAKAIMAFMRE